MRQLAAVFVSLANDRRVQIWEVHASPPRRMAIEQYR
jgi:hypothetical protein